MKGRLLTIREVAGLLHVSRSHAYSLMRHSNIPIVRIGSLVRVRPEDLELFIRERSSRNFKKPRVKS